MVAMLKVPGITLISLSLMGVAATWIILDPILEPHLEEQVTFFYYEPNYSYENVPREGRLNTFQFFDNLPTNLYVDCIIFIFNLFDH